MTRRRPQTPGSDRDWRALADPLQARALDANSDKVTIRVRACPDGTRCAIVIASVLINVPPTCAPSPDCRATARCLAATAAALDDPAERATNSASRLPHQTSPHGDA